LNDVFTADSFWGIAALLWIVTGLWRAFGGLEKGSDYYLHTVMVLLQRCRSLYLSSLSK
jgi:putative membrane protein